jgi:2-succinyl-6-hydroxy-2,4-cyclohexadiene-1-carboxylate synthase
MELALTQLRSGDSRASTLFIHGLLGSSEDWRETITTFDSPGTCLGLDLPAHGSAAGAPLPFSSFEDFIDALGEALIKEFPAPLHGIGYSLGGRILIGLSQHFPTLFSRLSIISAFPGFLDDKEREARRLSDQRWSELLTTLDTPQFLEMWYAQETFGRSQWNDETLQRVLQARASLSLPHIAAFFDLTSAARMPSYWEHLATTPTPVTFIAGARDKRYVTIASALKELRPSLTVRIVENAAHALPLEAPADLGKILSLQIDTKTPPTSCF